MNGCLKTIKKSVMKFIGSPDPGRRLGTSSSRCNSHSSPPNSGSLPSLVVSEIWTADSHFLLLWIWKWNFYGFKTCPNSGPLLYPYFISQSCCQFHNPVVNFTSGRWGEERSLHMSQNIHYWEGWSHYPIVNQDLVTPNSDYQIVRSDNRTR